MRRAWFLASMLALGCDSEKGHVDKVERLEQELKEAHVKERELHAELASCLESKTLLQNRRTTEPSDAGAPKPAPSPSAIPAPPPRLRCDPRDPLCEEEL